MKQFERSIRAFSAGTVVTVAVTWTPAVQAQTETEETKPKKTETVEASAESSSTQPSAATAGTSPAGAAPAESSEGTDGSAPPADEPSEGATPDEASTANANVAVSFGARGATTDASAESSASPTDSATSTTAQVPDYAGARATRREISLARRYAKLPYMERYKPEANLWEVGMFGGLFFPSSSHNLKVAVLPREEYSPVAGQLGGRLAYFPLSFLGLELEGMGAGGSTETTNFSAVFYGLRAHAVVQLPLFSVTPFALLGGGTLGASSETMGHDRDGAFHFGAGVKVPFSHRVSGRFDVRDTLSQKGNGAENGRQTHHPAVNLGVTFTFERTPPAPPSDRDYDGLYDDGEDQCPDQGALTASGCPGDSDADGVFDPVDECPTVAGEQPSGCPDLDADGDGVAVPADRCPNEKANTPDGCPEQDVDGDGFLGSDDRCPEKPETRNGFQDGDGCPDEMPEAVKRFTGVIRGINFRQGTAEIEESSFETLDSTIEILKKYPSITIEVSGHTSSEGTKERNQELSVERAEAVRSYFVDKGIDEKRVVARGAGSSEPIADNATLEGRKQNRRIEFRILSQR